MVINIKNIIVIIISFILSILLGIYTQNVIMDFALLFTSILGAYYASEKNKISYLYGLINSILISVISYLNHFYGLFVFYGFIFSFLQVYGFISWMKSEVKPKDFTKKTSFLIVSICIISSLLLSYILSLIPMQEIPFFDANSNILNLCASILLILKFKESWIIWIFNNLFDLIIWTYAFLNNGESSEAMLIISISYLFLNIYGIIKWYKKS